MSLVAGKSDVGLIDSSVKKQGSNQTESSGWKRVMEREKNQKRSRMWLLLWVRKFTCWLRWKEERRD